ncbi:MAG: hypothetical protein IIB00_00105 [candidate division Zixibacteria bacterium]|nr:hypothetical protein [candidate division Zixibacteria bacterium]
MNKHISTANKPNPKHAPMVGAKTGLAEKSLPENSISVDQALSLKLKSFEWTRVGGEDNPYNHFLLPILMDLFQTKKVSEFNLKSLASMFPIPCQPLLVLDQDVVSPSDGASLPLNEIRELVNSNNVDQCVSKIRVPNDSNNSSDTIIDTMEFFGGATLGSSNLIVGALYDATTDRNCEMTTHLRWLSKQITTDLLLLNNLFSQGDVTESTALVENATGTILWRPNEGFPNFPALNELLENAQRVMGVENQRGSTKVWRSASTRQITLVTMYEKDNESKEDNNYHAIKLRDNHKGAIRSISRIVASTSLARDFAGQETDNVSAAKRTGARSFTERSLISLSQSSGLKYQDDNLGKTNRLVRHLRKKNSALDENAEREILKRKVVEFTEAARKGSKVRLNLRKTEFGNSISLETDSARVSDKKDNEK